MKVRITSGTDGLLPWVHIDRFDPRLDRSPQRERSFVHRRSFARTRKYQEPALGYNISFFFSKWYQPGAPQWTNRALLYIYLIQYMSTHQGLSFLDPRPPLPADAESIETMQARAQEFWEDVVVPLTLESPEKENRTIAIVSHGAFRAYSGYSRHSQNGLFSLGLGQSPKRYRTDLHCFSLLPLNACTLVKTLLTHLAHPSVSTLR